MDKTVQITLIIAASVLVLFIIGINFYDNLGSSKTISAQGSSELTVSPNTVSIYFNIETNGSTATIAKDKNSEISDKVIEALIKQGFARSEIQTLNYNIYPEYLWEKDSQRQVGFKAVHSLKVEFNISRINKIGDVIDAGVDNGAGISYINFEISKDLQNKYKADALKAATQDSRNKAQSIADGLGRKLGGIYSVTTSDYGYYPYRAYDMVGSSNAEQAKSELLNIQPSDQSITAQVTVTYKIR